jgi:hypothetical protein
MDYSQIQVKSAMALSTPVKHRFSAFSQVIDDHKSGQIGGVATMAGKAVLGSK